MEQFKASEMKTALYERHCALSAKIVDFFGWEMPLQYRGVIEEHRTVRLKVGIFDVSHMGRISIKGKDAESFLDYISTNKIAGKPNNSATYTVWCNRNGYCVDDVIIYKEDHLNFFVIVNAGNREKDLNHLMQEGRSFQVEIQDHYATDGIVAIQGPYADQLVSSIFSQSHELKSMNFCKLDYNGTSIIISRTGYTGAGGFEVYAPHATIISLWDLLLSRGAMYGIEPIGLGARDTLRLEMGYALYGHEISEEIAPIESVSAWTVKFDKTDFLGKIALQLLEKNPAKRSEYGIVLLDPGIARSGYEVFKNDEKIGIVTSGTHSPSLNQAIAIILVNSSLKEGEIVEIQIRKNRCRAQIVKIPFRSIHEIHRVT